MTVKILQKTLTTTIGCAVFLNSLLLGTPPVKAVEFTSPDMEAPTRRVGGATRGNLDLEQTCVTDNQKDLTALVPKAEVTLTSQKYPTLFWYLPETSPATIEFHLIDDRNGDIIYHRKMKTNGESGIVSLSLPENTSLPPLEINTDYYWSFTIMCDRLNWQVNPNVEGFIRRVEPSPSLVEDLNSASAIERVSLYAKAGIWQDTISSLATLRRSNPDNAQLMVEWEELLRSVELDALIPEPLNRPLVSNSD